MAAIPNNNNPFVVDNNGRSRVLNSQGVVAFRSGQAIDSSFTDSIVAVYGLLVYHPMALILLVFGVFIFFAEYHQSHGPLEAIMGAVVAVAQDTDAPELARYASSFLATIFHHLIDYKIIVGKICLVWFSYVCKPSRRNLIFSSLLTVFVLFREVTYFELIVISQSYFLFTTLRNPSHKFFVLIIGVLIFCIGVFHLDSVVENLTKLHSDLNVKPKTKMGPGSPYSTAIPKPQTIRTSTSRTQTTTV